MSPKPASPPCLLIGRAKRITNSTITMQTALDRIGESLYDMRSFRIGRQKVLFALRYWVRKSIPSEDTQ